VARNRVDWADPRISSKVYEDMVAVLISRLHPEARRVDGSGGDAGRDVLLPLPTGLEIFELKSFTGRVGKKQREQIKSSLKKASSHSPSAWHLVVPIDPTPGESTWFEKMVNDLEITFPCDWLGQTWLDGHIANHLELPRYYIEGTAEEIVEALMVLQSEQAYLAGGLPDAIQRISRLTARLNELDPHYLFGYSTDPATGTKITIIPRYPGAEQDAPLTIRASFQFPDTDDGRAAADALRESVDYGIPTTVSADFVTEISVQGISGLGDPFTGQLAIGQSGLPAGDLPQMALRVVDDRGFSVTQLPLKVISRTAGLHGGELKFTDYSGAVHVSMRGDVTTRRFSLNYHYKPDGDALPCIIRPAIKFLSELHAGRSVIVLINNEHFAPPVVPSVDLSSQDAFEFYAQLAYALDDIQRKSGVYFPMPTTVSMEEYQNIVMASRLFAGETLTSEWESAQITVRAEGLSNIMELARNEVSGLWVNAEFVLSLDGREYTLGLVSRTHATARLDSVPELPADIAPDAEVELTLVPGSDASVSIALVETA
jgi:hypothetical protein